MNEIIKATPLELNFILDIHETRFVEHTIKEYMEYASKVGDIPTCNEVYYDPVTFFASVVYSEHEDMNIVEEMLSRYTKEEDLYEYALDQLDTMSQDWPEYMNEYHAQVMEDVMSVLEFYHFCFMEREYNPFSGITHLWIHNEPFITVW